MGKVDVEQGGEMWKDTCKRRWVVEYCAWSSL